MLFFYLRHGDPIYDPDSLTALGKRQAEALGRRLALHGLDRIYASSSVRAVETARPACEILKKEPTLLPWAQESLAWEELALDAPDGRHTWPFYIDEYVTLFSSAEMRALDKNWAAHPALKGTKLEKGLGRIQWEADAFFESLGYVHDHAANAYRAEKINSQRVALFAHQGFGMAFLSCVLDIPYPQLSTRFDMGHTGMTVIHFPEKTGLVVPKVLQLSGDGHLYAAGLPTTYQNGIPI